MRKRLWNHASVPLRCFPAPVPIIFWHLFGEVETLAAVIAGCRPSRINADARVHAQSDQCLPLIVGKSKALHCFLFLPLEEQYSLLLSQAFTIATTLAQASSQPSTATGKLRHQGLSSKTPKAPPFEPNCYLHHYFRLLPLPTSISMLHETLL